MPWNGESPYPLKLTFLHQLPQSDETDGVLFWSFLQQSWPQLATWFPAFLEGTAGALDVAVYHSYNQIVPDPPRILYLNQTPPSGDVATQKGASPGGTGWQAKAMAGWAKAASVPVWLGEGGPHNGGGGGEYSSTFVSSFGASCCFQEPVIYTAFGCALLCSL